MEEKKNNIWKVIGIILLVAICAVSGYFGFKQGMKYADKEDNKIEEKESNKAEKKEETKLELTDEKKEQLVDFIYAIGIFEGKDIKEVNLETKKDDEKMYATLYATYGTYLVRSSVCADSIFDTELDEKDMPKFYNNMTFVENYKNNKYLLNDANYVLSDKYQDAKDFMVKYENGKFYINTRFCGAEGLNSFYNIYLKDVAVKDNQVIVSVNYVYYEVVLDDEGNVSYNTYDEEKVESSKNIESGIQEVKDFSKYKTYDYVFERTDDTFILKSILVK